MPQPARRECSLHTAVWIATAIGIALLWKAVERPDARLSDKALSGSIVLGSGLFNLIEGLIDHHILNIHHVYERLGQSIWDYVFLASGIAMILVGWRMLRAARAELAS